MNKKQRTSIDNLAIAGFELSEEHMSLASGGLPMRTANREATYTHNQCMIDIVYYIDPEA